MKKIDRYILQKFVVTFFFSIFLFTFIAVVIDISEKTDDFVKANLTWGQIFSKYYAGFIPSIMAMLFPLFVFISVIFFTSKMAERAEVIAILAGGISFKRFLLPYAWGGLFFGALLLLANYFLVPKSNAIVADFKTKILKDDPKGGFGNQNYYLRVDSNTYVGVRMYDSSSKLATNVFLFKTKGNELTYNLRCDMMRWDAAKKRWKMEQPIERIVVGKNEIVRQLKDTSLSLNFKPSDLLKDDFLKDKLSTPALNEFIRMQELRGAEGLNAIKVERYRRDASAASVVILTLIGAIVASRKIRGGSGFHLAVGIVTAAIYILSDRFSTVFAQKGNFPPLLAAWTPNVIFTYVAWRLYQKAPK